MRREIRTPYYRRNPSPEINFKPIIISWLEFSLKIGIAFGAFIAWLFYYLYVGAMPAIGNIGDITIFLLMIAGVGVLIAFILFFFHFGPALSLRIEINEQYKRKKLILTYIAIPVIIHIIGWSYFLDIKNHTEHYLLILSSLVIILYFLSDYDKYYLPFHSFYLSTYYLLYSLGLISWFALAFSNFQKSGDIILYLFDTLIIAYITVFNLIILKKDPIIKTLAIIGILLLFTISQFFNVHRIDNPMITYPFHALKLGYYKAELYFKNDFINKSNPFPLNENNQTLNTFFILSSIGDEYILRETRTAEDHNDSNVSNHNSLYPFDYNETRYYCEDDNISLIWKISDLNNTYIQKVTKRSYDFNKTVEKLLTHWKTIDQKIYRIKKENIDFEMVGKEIEKQSTIWRINSSKKSISSKDKNTTTTPPQNNQQKPKKHCISNISIQSCYCSYPNNQLLQTSQP
ncbi:hypothetical protein [Sulfuricurvum sp.]|uniref:hypothetical protein n=1 Tax=Sulfuricurvum sp. TaxID=2025608 RepID=UPI00261EFBBE|nr:hypothetical protein [Sulfuricurvum sp.]MDD4885048.1 hypothetical protein [Sulfuricurvum sp.]